MMAGWAAALFTVAAVFLPHSPAALTKAISGYGWIAPAVFAALWMVLTPALFSGTILAAAAGLLFGPVLGTAVGVIGGTLGGLLSCWLARRWGAAAFAALARPGLSRVLERVNERPFRSVLVLRVMPGMPATWLNYAAGLTRIPYASFAAASALASAPRILIYAGLAGSVSHPNPRLAILSLVLFGTLGVVGVLAAMRERRALGLGRP